MHPFSTQTRAGQVHLRIMETTDLHAHLLPYDYYADRPAPTVGLSRTACLIATARREAANCLLLDNGDFVQGNPLGDYFAQLPPGDGPMPHPVIAAMNRLGYDAAALGNHEFNYGLEFLQQALSGAAFPVLCANVATKLGDSPPQDTTLLPPYVVLQRKVTDGAGGAHDLRIGLIGVLPPQITTWDRRHLTGRVQSRDILETLRAYVPLMRQAGANIILAMCHSGISAAPETPGMEHASVPAAAIDGIDALLIGHTHMVFPGPGHPDIAVIDAIRGTIHGKPAVMAGYAGSHLGLIDLSLVRENGGWRIDDHRVQTRPIARRAADGHVTELAENDTAVAAGAADGHRRTLAYIRRPVGRATAPLHSYFAQVANDPSVQFVTRAKRWFMADHLKDSAFADLPLLSAAAPFKTGGRAGPEWYTNVPAGDLAIRNIADLYVFPNMIRAVLVTGAQLRDWLEHSAGAFCRLTPGQPDQMLLDPAFPSYYFDVISGVTYAIDLSQPARFSPTGAMCAPEARRIRDLCYQGRPVTPQMRFVIATNSFRAAGGGNFSGAEGDTVIAKPRDSVRDVITRYVAAQGAVNPEVAAIWSFRHLPGTTALFDTSPQAARYLPGVTDRQITPAGPGPCGFARFRLTL